MGEELTDRIAVVTGATRGCGRGIAVELGAAGATVYVTGRTTRDSASPMGRPETIEETAELVTAAGGTGIPVRCDFTEVADVDALAARIDAEHGRLDVLVDDVWGGDPFVEHGKPFWESDLDAALGVLHNGLDSHLVALHRLLPLLVRSGGGGLVVEITDGDDDTYHGTALPYYLVKSGIRRIGHAMAEQLRPRGVTAVSLTPGYIRSEAMLAGRGVTEETWRDAIAEDPHFAMAESPRYVGRAVVALAGDPEVGRWAGQPLSSWGLMRVYGYTDLDGSRPDWGRWYEEVYLAGRDATEVDPTAYR